MKLKSILILLLLFYFQLLLINCEDIDSYSDDDNYNEVQTSVSRIDPRFVITIANVYGRIYRIRYVYDDIRTVHLDNSCNESNPSSNIAGLTNWSIRIYDENWNLVTSGLSTSDFNNGAGWFQLGTIDAPGNYHFVVTDAYGNIYMGLKYGKAVENYQWTISYPAGYNSCTAINCTGGVPDEFLVYPDFADSKVKIYREISYKHNYLWVRLYVKNCSPVQSVTTSGESSYGQWNDITLAAGDSILIGSHIQSTQFDAYVCGEITSSSPPDEISSNNETCYSYEGSTQH